MTKFGFILQKVIVGALLVASMVTVIPFLLLVADSFINKEFSLQRMAVDFIYLKLDDYITYED